MSQFTYMNDIANICGLDGDLTRGPMPRWQKKLETSSNNSSFLNNSKLSVSYNNVCSGNSAAASHKTPNKKTPGKKTPSGKSSGRKTTPGSKERSKTPTGGDRFIPSRVNSNFELGHYAIAKEHQKEAEEGDSAPDNAKRVASMGEQKKLLTEAIQGATGEGGSQRILSYHVKAPSAPDSHQNPLKVVYSTKTPISTKSGTRYIPHAPERILDAPDIINDYYLNLMDWSQSNVVTIALGNCIYLWNASNGKTDQLLEYDEGEHACSLSWIQGGNILAVGNNSGAVELWDCTVKKRLRVMSSHENRVGVLAWNSHIVTSGSRNGIIVNHDVRTRNHCVNRLNGHTQEVCGLRWSPDGRHLASGGNDNLVNVWPVVAGSHHSADQPLYTFSEHHAAVRALAWCPWAPNILASGGGTADRCIKFWNVNNGNLMDSVDSKSQVCALLFSSTYKELISAHGYVNNQLTIWKYPSMSRQAELTGHTARVLQMAMSPDGSTVISASADETLRLWNCFAPDPNQAKKGKASSSVISQSVLRASIR
ncbi:cell division cycle protein 20 homolog [Lutzomyia longipalpis]|uniref:cell division cycle protein 20 homolog n=1 Tax=Lutzomyia longipalpis TaxID=7200 RepID=UPI00248369DC|nr:cell division cycle protein 20 homolog [Lutzomyia longipalpis]XP_055687835.1 cell division cycle protein 20 homolog [Lutzomyia longipalpis]XP_055687836.1 cell division cycle protein 20 homolog [Lutzomyia longipalpis]